MKFGLGFGLNKNNGLLQSFAQLVIDAGGVLYLDARKADGSGPLTGNDSPFVDLTKIGNNGTLTNFAGTGTSGWQATPNLLRFDGVDDFVSFADTASLDIVNAPLAIGVTFYKSAEQNAYVLNKNTSSSADTQYSILLQSHGDIAFLNEGSLYAVIASSPINKYINVVFYWDGSNVTSYLNGSQQNQDALVGSLTSYGSLNIGRRKPANAYLNGDIATVTIYTGSDINKILKAEAKISAEYLALNP